MEKIKPVLGQHQGFMKKLTSVIFLSLGVFLFAHGAQAQTLWGGTTYGMSAADVLRTLPGSKKIHNGDSLANGAQELVRLEKVGIVKQEFDARFFFLNNKLIQVTLVLRGKPQFSSALLVFEALSKAFTSRYGAARSRQIDSKSKLKVAMAAWVSGGTHINILVMALGDRPAIINISYRPGVLKKANKL